MVVVKRALHGHPRLFEKFHSDLPANFFYSFEECCEPSQSSQMNFGQPHRVGEAIFLYGAPPRIHRPHEVDTPLGLLAVSVRAMSVRVMCT